MQACAKCQISLPETSGNRDVLLRGDMLTLRDGRIMGELGGHLVGVDICDRRDEKVERGRVLGIRSILVNGTFGILGRQLNLSGGKGVGGTKAEYAFGTA